MNNHRLHTCLPAGRDLKKLITQIILLTTVYCLLSTQIGCESFRKKFIRKPKYQPPPEEMVIEPKDYSKLQLPVNKAYIQYYTYWKAWHNELLNFLNPTGSKKKILSCFEQTLLNLSRMRDLLANEDKINLLEDYITKVSSLEKEVETKEIAMISFSRFRTQSEQLLRNIQRDFSFSKVKDSLKW